MCKKIISTFVCLSSYPFDGLLFLLISFIIFDQFFFTRAFYVNYFMSISISNTLFVCSHCLNILLPKISLSYKLLMESSFLPDWLKTRS